LILNKFKTSGILFLGELLLIVGAFSFAIYKVLPNMGAVGILVLFVGTVIAHLDQFSCITYSDNQILITHPYSIFSESILAQTSSVSTVRLLTGRLGRKLVFSIKGEITKSVSIPHISDANLTSFSDYLHQNHIEIQGF
jgi:hypothetical protein